MEYTEVAPDTFLMRSAYDEVRRVADRLGLQPTLIDEPDQGNRPRMFTITVERPESADDWSMAPTKIAMGTDLLVVINKALKALREMEPRLQRKLAEIEEPEPDYVRLHPDDIEAIAEAIVRHARDPLLIAAIANAIGSMMD